VKFRGGVTSSTRASATSILMTAELMGAGLPAELLGELLGLEVRAANEFARSVDGWAVTGGADAGEGSDALAVEESLGRVGLEMEPAMADLREVAEVEASTAGRMVAGGGAGAAGAVSVAGTCGARTALAVVNWGTESAAYERETSGASG